MGSSTIQVSIYQSSIPHILEEHNVKKNPILILLVQEQTHAKLHPTPTILDLPKQLAVHYLENSPLSVYRQVHHHQEKSPPVGSILRTIVHDFSTNFFQISFNILQSISSSANLLSTLKIIHNKLGNAHRENTSGPSLITVSKLVKLINNLTANTKYTIFLHLSKIYT